MIYILSNLCPVLFGSISLSNVLKLQLFNSMRTNDVLKIPVNGNFKTTNKVTLLEQG